MELLKKWYNDLIIIPYRKKKLAIAYDAMVSEFPFDCIIAGGTLRDYFLYGKINKSVDVDIFFLSEEEIYKAKEWLNEKINKNNILKRVIGENVYLISEKFGIEYNFVLWKTYEDVKELLDSFDFSVSMVAIYKNKLYFNNAFFKDLYDKNITIVNFEDTISSLHRLAKYKEKGFKVSKETIKSVFEFNSKNPDKLFTRKDSCYGEWINFDINNACNILGVTITCKLKRI